MEDNNPFAAKFGLGPKQNAAMPQPNMKQALGAPKAMPAAPMPPTGGLSKAGSKPAMPATPSMAKPSMPMEE